ncbi:MAG: hypothetical protein HZA62_06135 [Rhodocyclales bacterium]|nr:hypothetical protein [Rhodocyclales bacterium]
MAKPVYSLVYAILITLGLLALVLFNRMIGSDEAAPAAQASLQRNEATAREAREAVADATEKAAPGEVAEPTGDKAVAKADIPVAGARDEEQGK